MGKGSSLASSFLAPFKSHLAPFVLWTWAKMAGVRQATLPTIESKPTQLWDDEAKKAGWEIDNWMKDTTISAMNTHGLS